MIYIFDDKKSRQVGYGWTGEKFDKYEGFIRPISQYSQINDEVERRKIFSEGNIVLFHESFFDADFNKRDKEALKIRRDLEAFAKKNSRFYLAFFSGSKSENSIDNNVGYLPVSVLYQNLEELIHQYVNGKIDLRYLLYGKKPDIEHEFVNRLNAANNTFETKKVLNRNLNENILVARTIDNCLPPIINEVEYKMLNGSTDGYFHEKTLEWLQEKQYDKIFIPLCFGTSLSDFNGLRLAIHIRCTVTPNQCTPIYIYSFVGMEELINQGCFNILKTKNVELIEYNLTAFDDAINSNNGPMVSAELPQEIAKLKLDVPENYEDSHSIANEWAIYRWANAIHADNMAIERIIENVNTQLYFKYLSTIYPTNEIPEIGQHDLKLDNPGQPRILYVDDDAEKGWYEILCSILCDTNEINSFDYLGDDIKKVSQDEIIKKTVRKIKEEDIDLVILDFRLHPDDFTAINIQDVTGLKLLKNIKEINPGIQVLIFSASSKVWTFTALQNAGADGFILKESPELSADGNYTKVSLLNLVHSLNQALNMSFLKKVHLEIKEIEALVSVGENEDEAEFIIRLKNNLEIAFQLLINTKYSIRYFNYAYLQFFQIIEDFSNMPYVFSEGSDCYVFVKSKGILINKTLKDKWETAISMDSGKYKILPKTVNLSEKRKRIDTNYRVSSILIFRLGYPNSSVWDWTDIYTVRNTKAAHFNIENSLDQHDIFKVLNFIKNFINNKEQKETNIDKGLKGRSFEENLEILKSRYAQ